MDAQRTFSASNCSTFCGKNHPRFPTTMKLEDIEKQIGADVIRADMLHIMDADGAEMVRLELDGTHPDCPVNIIKDGDLCLSVANRDIPQLVKGLAMLCNEDYF